MSPSVIFMACATGCAVGAFATRRVRSLQFCLAGLFFAVCVFAVEAIR